MTKYLLDTNICIFFFKKKYQLGEKVQEVGFQNCFISEITIAELKYGAEYSSNPEKHRKVIEEFQQKIQIIPIFSSLDVYAVEKSKLRKSGKLIDDFDLLIGATAKCHNFVLVTNNIKHFARIENLKIEDWTN